jgi:hypothetical protein
MNIPDNMEHVYKVHRMTVVYAEVVGLTVKSRTFYVEKDGRESVITSMSDGGPGSSPVLVVQAHNTEAGWNEKLCPVVKFESTYIIQKSHIEDIIIEEYSKDRETFNIYLNHDTGHFVMIKTKVDS